MLVSHQVRARSEVVRIASGTYERAVEQFLRSHRLPYLAVNQRRRPLTGQGPVKNFDFLVRARSGQHYLVEVKGRQFPYVLRGKKVYWENWVHEEDLEGLRLWRGYFGFGFTGVVCYAYLITEPEYVDSFPSRSCWQGREFGLVAITLEDFVRWSRQRSSRWKALHIPPARFRQLIRPLGYFLLGETA